MLIITQYIIIIINLFKRELKRVPHHLPPIFFVPQPTPPPSAFFPSFFSINSSVSCHLSQSTSSTSPSRLRQFRFHPRRFFVLLLRFRCHRSISGRRIVGFVPAVTRADPLHSKPRPDLSRRLCLVVNRLSFLSVLTWVQMGSVQQVSKLISFRTYLEFS